MAVIPMTVMTVATFPVGVAAHMAMMAATAMLGHGRARDRQGCQDGGNNREFSKHLLIPFALGRRDFARQDLCIEMLPVPLTQNPNLEFCEAHHLLSSGEPRVPGRGTG
jgi:hypothetical protein